MYKIPFLDIERYEYKVDDINLWNLLSIDNWSTLLCVPVNKFSNYISICAVEPSPSLALKLEELLGLKVLFFMSTEEQVKKVLESRKNVT